MPRCKKLGQKSVMGRVGMQKEEVCGGQVQNDFNYAQGIFKQFNFMKGQESECAKVKKLPGDID